MHHKVINLETSFLMHFDLSMLVFKIGGPGCSAAVLTDFFVFPFFFVFLLIKPYQKKNGSILCVYTTKVIVP